jgi:hypothetical protein
LATSGISWLADAPDAAEDALLRERAELVETHQAVHADLGVALHLLAAAVGVSDRGLDGVEHLVDLFERIGHSKGESEVR